MKEEYLYTFTYKKKQEVWLVNPDFKFSEKMLETMDGAFIGTIDKKEKYKWEDDGTFISKEDVTKEKEVGTN